MSDKSRCENSYSVVTLLGVSECTLFSSELRTSRLVVAAGAALGLRITCHEALPNSYPDSGLLLIATDLLPTSIPIRPGVLLLDREIAVVDSFGSLVGMSGEDRDAVTNLVSRIGDCLADSPRAHVLSISASGGGFGLTTLVALLGLASTRSGRRTLLVDQHDGLIRILGASAASVDHQLQPTPPPKTGVLSSKVPVSHALLRDARTRFDVIIMAKDAIALEPEARIHFLILSANTALATERSARQLAAANSKRTRILLRQMPHGSLSRQQVAAALHQRSLLEWPDDRTLALAADLGDLGRARSAIERARKIWLELGGGFGD